MVACTNCGANSIEHDSAMGNSFCTNCGLVVEENSIVSEVTFGETSSGQAVLQGSFVADGRRGVAGVGPGGRRQVSMLSKEQSIANGRRAILAVGTALRLTERYTDTAQRYFNLAIANNFTAGRKTAQVAAACLYAACRAEKTSHMLIDFSDVMQINVFVLGNIFLKMIKELHISLPLVDPSLYISRFAALLEFGEHTQQVAGDAMRLVQRMDRDWLHTGRRPAGICGACLLIAARMNNFHRTPQEIIQVVKIAEVTLRKRLEEFSSTATGKLNVRDFRTVWLESAADPPSFDRSHRLKKRKKGEGDEDNENDENDEEKDKSGDEIDELESRLKRNKKVKLGDEEKEEEEEGNNQDSNSGDVEPVLNSLETNTTPKDSLPPTQNLPGIPPPPPPPQTGPLEIHENGNGHSRFEPTTQAPRIDLTTGSEPDGANGIDVENDTAVTTATEASQAEEDAALEKEMEGFLESDELKMISLNMDVNPVVAESASFSDLEDDAEIENVMLNNEEVVMKKRIWEEFNKDWILAQEEKRRIALLRGEDPTKPGGRRKGGGSGRKSNNTNPNPATSAADAAKQLLSQKKLSKKINYAALDALFEDDPQGAAATAVARRSVRANAAMGSALAGEDEEETTSRRGSLGTTEMFSSPSRILGNGSALTRSLRAGSNQKQGLGRALSRSSSSRFGTRSPSVVSSKRGLEARNSTTVKTNETNEEDGDEDEDEGEGEDVDDWKRQVKKVGKAGRDLEDDDAVPDDDEDEWWDGHDEL